MVSGRNADVGESSMAKLLCVHWEEHDRVKSFQELLVEACFHHSPLEVLVFHVVALCVGWFSEPMMFV